jgi:hypothetical protein
MKREILAAEPQAFQGEDRIVMTNFLLPSSINLQSRPS